MSTAQTNEFETSTGVLWDDPEAGQTWLVTIVGVVILAGLVIFLSVVYFRGEEHEVEAKVIDPAYLALADAKQAQQSLLASSGSYSVEVGGQQVKRNRIPVAKAMEMLAANPALAVPAEGAKKPKAAAPGAPAAPAPAAPAPAAKSPAPTAPATPK
jgi:hypothetical protein